MKQNICVYGFVDFKFPEIDGVNTNDTSIIDFKFHGIDGVKTNDTSILDLSSMG